MKTNFDISIIVCCYGGEKTIEECLNSLKNQRRNDISIEVLLIDDGSKDKTALRILNFLEKNSTFINLEFKYIRKKNEGLSTARNFGIKNANSSIIAFIDEDAVADEKFSENLIKLFNENKDVNCIGGRVDLLNEDCHFAKIIQNGIFKSQIKNQEVVIGTNMAFRKEFVEKIGGFQPEFTYRGDESAFFVKAKNEIKILISENVIVKHPQPPNLLKWLNTRYENGYFGAAIHELEKMKKKMRYKRLLFSIFTLFFPVIIFLSFVLFNENLFSLLFMMIYIVFFIKRFFVSKLIISFIKEYNSNIEKDILVSFYVGFISIIGYLTEDWGDIKGFIKYRNFKWSNNELTSTNSE